MVVGVRSQQTSASVRMALSASREANALSEDSLEFPQDIASFGLAPTLLLLLSGLPFLTVRGPYGG
jgi:hypothetical protein